VKKQGNALVINPVIPNDWAEYGIEYNYKDTKY
jgi:cellobiose phosphorylase